MSTDPIPPDLPPDVLGSIPLFAELQKVLSWSGGPVNWDLARQIAVAAAASTETAHQIAAQTTGEAADDGRLAEMWIGQATPLEPVAAPLPAITPAQWAERACAAYRELIDPLAAKVSGAIASQLPDAINQGGLPPGIDAGAIGQAMAQMGPLLLGVQVGSIIGGVAKDLLGVHDLPVPAADPAFAAIVGPSVDQLAADWSLDPREARMFVAVHETAHRTLQQTMPAVRGAFFAAFLDFVASLSIDFSSAFERLQGLDWSDPSGVADAAGTQGFFELLDDPGSSHAAANLERIVALVEATADRVVDAATDGRLPSGARIREAAARHRTGRDGVAAMTRFIGLGTEAADEARKAADEFTRTVLDTAGWPALMKMWEDTDAIPSRDELATPNDWLERTR